jgi:translation initiation factor IF-1
VGADKAVGAVLEERPSAIYAVRLETGQQVLAHLVGTVKRNFVRLVPGDRVEVELTPHDPTRARITKKLGNHESSSVRQEDLR